MKSVYFTLSLVGCLVGQGSCEDTPPGSDAEGCLGLPCARPPCKELRPTWIIQNGKLCPGCPRCACPNTSCPPVACKNPEIKSYNLADGTECQECPKCKPEIMPCPFDCRKADCENPMSPIIMYKGELCKSCAICPWWRRCKPYFCPDCVTVSDWKQTYDRYGCPVGCAPCMTGGPGENSVENNGKD